MAQLEGFYGKPRIDRETLAAHSEGIIATTGCLAAEVPRTLVNQGEKAAYDRLKWYLDVFGSDRFFLELQPHDIPELKQVNDVLLRWTKKYGVGLVATNDVHYVRKEDANPHDVLLCIQTHESLSNPSRLRLTPDGSYYISSYEEMVAVFGDYPEALSNTLYIAEMCEVDLDNKGYRLPEFPVPEGYDAQSYLRMLVERGLVERYGEERAKHDHVLRERVERELGIIHNMGFDTYFLIVWDLCKFAADSDIWWNVRGSGAGSLVAYTLRITNIDPIKNDLIFERFLNPARVSMPDIDIDFPDDRRADMIEYAVRKYGEDKCAAIITFGTLGARAAVRDVGRVLEVPLSEVDRVARMVPNVPGKPVRLDALLFDEETAEEWPTEATDIREAYKQDPTVQELLDMAIKLEGQTRHASTHAAGVVISDRPIVEYAPLHRPTKGNDSGPIQQVVQFDMNIVESIGLLKVDFLGLATISIMRRACELIEKRRGCKLDLNTIPYERCLEDPERDADVMKAYQLLQAGHTVGVFQVEGAGLRRTLQEMRPDQFEHIIAAISLYRPGPMEYIPSYIRRMHGEEEVEYHHPALKPILENTYAIIVYQEQIMRIASDLAGYSPGEADLMRRAVSKKKAKEIEKHKKIFVEGAVGNGIPQKVAEDIYGDIEFFARYGFNKCIVGNTEVVDAATGRLVKIEDLHDGEARLDETLTCNIDDLTLQSGRVLHVMDNGVRPVFKLATALGRTIEATLNHPFYTFDGWRLLEELEEGALVAVPRQIPVEGKVEWPEHEVIVLGHLLAEGNLCHPHSVYFYSQDSQQRDDFIQAAERFDNVRCTVSLHRATYSVYAARMDRKVPPGIVPWAKALGIWGKSARDKEIPAEAFELTNRQLGLLLSRMWEGDGHINLQGRSLYYATASERMARQMQHLLLRFGIISRLRTVEFPYKDGRIGYQLFITGNENIVTFAEQIGCHFLSEERQQALEGLCLDELLTSSTKDVVPLGVKELVRGAKERADVSWIQMNVECGVAQREFYPTGTASKAGFHRQTIGRLADYFGDPDLRRYAESDVYWDHVVSVEYVGERQTYDLEVPGTRNFIANDILVHNSHAADYAVITVQTAYLKAHYPVEYMCALLEIEFDDSAKVPVFINECRRLGIDVLPPDINASGAKFTIEENPEKADLPEDDYRRWAIRVGLGAIKNVGLGAVEAILAEREANGPFKSLDDFCERVDLRYLNRRVIECMAKVGCFDELVRPVAPEAPRETVVAVIDRMMGVSGQIHEAAEVGQLSMFDMMAASNPQVVRSSVLRPLPDVGHVIPKQRLLDEKELLGVYISEHPLQQVAEEVGRSITCFCGEISYDQVGQSVVIAGLLSGVRVITTKKGDRMAFVKLEDLQGTVEVVVFPRTYEQAQAILEEDNILLVRGRVESRNDRMSVLADEVRLYEANATMPGEEGTEVVQVEESSLLDGMQYHVTITMRRTEDANHDVTRLQRVLEALQLFPGEDRISLRCVRDDGKIILLDFPKLSTNWNAQLREMLAVQDMDVDVKDLTPDRRQSYRKSA
ncbi:MAG: DNA polymerase III subunit alpha [Chloroflexota bacterium]|nr:DNA polymerase III subunit alpha [Chloroflexota bacterium]